MRSRILLVLAILAIVAYLPTLWQPLLEDDYPNIGQAHEYGTSVVTNSVFSVRATQFLAADAIYRIFGVYAPAYYTFLILLHVLNTWLVYALGAWRLIGHTVSVWAAAFFSVYEGHQEGIMWFSGATEPLLFVFAAGALACWIEFLRTARWTWYVAALAAFVGGLYSKESAFIVVPLLALPIVFERTFLRRAVWLLPFAALATIAVAHILHTRTYSFRFNDGSFSLHAPFWLTWPSNFARLFWFWGLLAVVTLLLWKPSKYLVVLAIGVLWAGLSLIPYSFLTYSTRIPSRQLYLASAGVALIVGCALAALAERWWRRRASVVAAVCALMLIHNVGYLWTRKRAQFLARAAPTEQLIALARSTRGPIYVRCFPRPPIVADFAVRLTTGRDDLIWDAAQSGKAAATFCYTEK